MGILEVKIDGLPEVRERLLRGPRLACHVQLRTPRHVESLLLPDHGRELDAEEWLASLNERFEGWAEGRGVGTGPSLDAWGKHGRFSYVGDLEKGTRVKVGRDKEFLVTAGTYRDLVAHFAGRDVPIGISRRPARGSLGSWLRAKLGIELAVVYVGPILVRQGAAERIEEGTLRFGPES